VPTRLEHIKSGRTPVVRSQRVRWVRRERGGGLNWFDIKMGLVPMDALNYELYKT